MGGFESGNYLDLSNVVYSGGICGELNQRYLVPWI